jgi:predicted DNA-binding transcriptional regulator YafY
MGFGCLARVLEPRELVEAIRQDVRQMAESYS